jgi:hypothetical protein
MHSPYCVQVYPTFNPFKSFVTRGIKQKVVELCGVMLGLCSGTLWCDTPFVKLFIKHHQGGTTS